MASYYNDCIKSVVITTKSKKLVNKINEYLPILQDCPLLDSINPDGIIKLLNCLNALSRNYPKNSFVFTADDKAEFIGVVLSGAIHIVQEDFWGGRMILTRVEPGGLFCESFSFAGTGKLPVGALAAEDSSVLLLNCKRIVTSCNTACEFHTSLIKNMIRILAEKNVTLTQKLSHVTRRTTREKLLSYLSEQARITGSSSFSIPFNRQELADFLAVDRSAMSGELSKMRDENLLRYNRNRFELL